MAIYESFLLQRIIFGEHAIDRIGSVALDMGIQNTLVVTDQGVVASGCLERCLHSLQRAGVAVRVFDGVDENPTTDTVDRGQCYASEGQPPDSLVAVGGGSSMDCAKAINLLLTDGGRMEDYRGLKNSKNKLLPAIGVPTTAGTGSEAQSYAIIAEKESGLKMACGDRQALFGTVILDPVLTSTMPPAVTAATGMDAISHAVESYVSTRRSPLSQMLAREAFSQLQAGFESVLLDPLDLEARGKMLWGAHFAGAAIENSMLGAAHACANPVTARLGIRHGVVVGILLPHVIRFNGPSVNGLYRDLVLQFSSNGANPAEELACRIKELQSVAGLASRLRDCGVEAGSLPDMAREAIGQWTGRFNPRALDEGQFLRLYEEAY